MSANINCITNCCEPPDEPPIDTCACPECVEVEGLAEGPEQFQVVISGLADADCDGCAGLNGTYILTCDEPTDCLWTFTMTPGPSATICTNLSLQVNLTMAASVATVTGVAERVTPGNFRTVFQFSKNFGGAIDCFNLTDESLTVTGGDVGDCDDSSATCLLSSA